MQRCQNAYFALRLLVELVLRALEERALEEREFVELVELEVLLLELLLLLQFLLLQLLALEVVLFELLLSIWLSLLSVNVMCNKLPPKRVAEHTAAPAVADAAVPCVTGGSICRVCFVYSKKGGFLFAQK